MKRLAAVRALLAVVLCSVVLGGCDFDVYKLPLPGGADVGKNPLTITVMFSDVLDLVPKSTVKVNDVNVGQVSDIELDGYTAVVTLKIRDNTRLPDNALAEIRQTSLLGEKFVSLSAPATDPSPNPLGNNDVIPLERAGRNPEIEEVLGALSLVLNGGGIAQLQTIAQELNKALAGREDSARSVLDQIDILTGNLDANKGDIVSAIEALNRLSLAAQKQLPIIDKTLAELPDALTSINAQRADLVKMLKALDDLSTVAVDVIARSKDSTIQTVKSLQPVLTKLADSGDDFVNSLNTAYAFPFVDETVGRDPQVARNLHVGDYTNLDAKLQIDLSQALTLPTTLPLPLGLPTSLLNSVQACLASGNLLSAQCTTLVGTKPLIDFCRTATSPGDVQFCKTISPLLIGTPDLGQVLGGVLPKPSGGAVGGTAPGSTPAPALPTALPSIPGLSQLPILGGLFRAGTGWAAPSPDGKGGPTVAQLQQVYDPDLVSLMIPGMVSTS